MSIDDSTPGAAGPDSLEPIAMERVANPETGPFSTGKRPRRSTTTLIWMGLIGLLGFIAHQVPLILAEYRGLQEDWSREAHSKVIGYRNLYPLASQAEMPRNWFWVDGASVRLWAGWAPGQGHLWFQIGRGDLQRDRLSHAVGRDVVRPIDRPIVEVAGGTCWARMPLDTPVFGNPRTSPPTAYPAVVLAKTLVVNEPARPMPTLVVFTPLAVPEQAVTVFDPRLGGQRLTMGTSGYLYGGHPLLYDRGTESLWAQDETSLVAVSGPFRGERLARLSSLSMVGWSDWQAKYPGSRLIVGADRSQPPPRR